MGLRIADLKRSLQSAFYFMLPEADWMEKLLVFLGRRRRFLVEGDSMLPTLKSGDVVLIKPGGGCRVGDIVLARHPYKKSVKVLKRLREIDEKGNLSLIGDNPSASTDSRAFGAILPKDVLGKAVSRLRAS